MYSLSTEKTGEMFFIYTKSGPSAFSLFRFRSVCSNRLFKVGIYRLNTNVLVELYRDFALKDENPNCTGKDTVQSLSLLSVGTPETAERMRTCLIEGGASLRFYIPLRWNTSGRPGALEKERFHKGRLDTGRYTFRVLLEVQISTEFRIEQSL